MDSSWPDGAESPDPASRYVNSVNIAFSQWDMTLDFRLTTPDEITDAGEATLRVERATRILMSPTHAKVLADIIQRAVSEWETKYGPLPDVSRLWPQPAATPRLTDAPPVTEAPAGEPGGPQ